MAPLNSLKWYVDSENMLVEQTPRGSKDLIAQLQTPFLGSGYNGGSEGEMDGPTKDLEVCQRASAPEVSLNVRAGMSPYSVFAYEEVWFDFPPHESP